MISNLLMYVLIFLFNFWLAEVGRDSTLFAFWEPVRARQVTGWAGFQYRWSRLPLLFCHSRTSGTLSAQLLCRPAVSSLLLTVLSFLTQLYPSAWLVTSATSNHRCVHRFEFALALLTLGLERLFPARISFLNSSETPGWLRTKLHSPKLPFCHRTGGKFSAMLLPDSLYDPEDNQQVWNPYRVPPLIGYSS